MTLKKLENKENRITVRGMRGADKSFGATNACGVQKLRFHLTSQHDKDAQYFHVPIINSFTIKN
jgi:hypothetical protein